MGTGQSLVGRRFGKQVVVSAVGGGKVEIKCDCGVVKETRIQYLVSGQSRSCGCGRRGDRKSPIVVGDVFERLTVIQKLGTNGHRREVLAKCQCGARKVVDEGSLRSGDTKSCGCLRRERMADLDLESHGQSGRTRSALYQCWLSVRVRVSDRDRYPSYAGIDMHPEWRDDFDSFRRYIDGNLGERPDGASLDRVDNDVGYVPGNLRWASSHQQARNRKSNRTITVGGVSRLLVEWSEATGIPVSVISRRISAGWTDAQAVTVRVGRRRK